MTDTEILYHCPLHQPEALQKKKTVTKYGEWQYYKCPVARCFVTCGVDCVEYYIDPTIRQLHQFYLENELDKMRCYCERLLIMSQPVPKRTQADYSSNIPNVTASSSSGLIKNPKALPKLGWKGAESRRGTQDPRSCSYPNKETPT